MRRFLVQVAIDTFSILVAVAILSRIDVAQPFPFGGQGTAPILSYGRNGYEWLELVITAALLTATYTVLRPLLVILTGRLLLWSLGTFQIVVIAIVLSVVAYVSPLS